MMPPSTLNEWERVLVKYFLAIGKDGDCSDIHAFEVTSKTLTAACGLEYDQESEVERAFHKVLVSDPLLEHVLQQGFHIRKTQELPGCFIYLTLTLFIDGLLDEHQSVNGAFRKKLASWLGIDRSFNDLKGVAAMWQALAVWLNERIDAGGAFRRLILPHPGGWKQIGHTRRLSFPTRHDFRMVEKFVSENDVDLDNPTALLIAFPRLLNDVSLGLNDAFEDFRHSYYARRRAIADHRFWCLILRIRKAATAERRQHAILEMTFNDYQEPEFHLLSNPVVEKRSYAALGAALADTSITSSWNLGAAIKRGFLFFRQVGMGRWQAETNLARCNARVFVGLASKIENVMGLRLGRLTGKSPWRITEEPKPISIVETAFVQARLLIDSDDSIFRPSVTDGIRVNGRWLGLPRFLPSIDADSSDLTIVSEAENSSPVNTISVGNVMQLSSDQPLSGIYDIEPELHTGEGSLPWRLRLEFTPHAFRHTSLDCARQKLNLLRDWRDVGEEPAICDGSQALICESGSPAVAWLLEAVYADGRSGWDEADLVSLVRRSDPEFENDPWTVLHLLQDGGIIEPRLRQGWKGRVWTLATPRVIRAVSEGREVALLEGALCSKFIEDFTLAVEGLGGTSFQRQGHIRWAVPVIGAINVSPALLAERLGLPLCKEIDSTGKVPLALARTERQAEHYIISSTWCWSAKRFVSGKTSEGSVRLTRRSHRLGTDHDVFCVEHAGRSFNYLSRCAAIIHAHALAGVALFKFREDRIERIAQDGALPDVLAATLRRRCLRAAGVDAGAYSYPATEADARWVSSMLSGCVADVEISTPQATGELLSAVRRSGGRLRARWEGGELSIKMNKSMRGFNGS
ncbi:hypothetical protein MJ904_07390 [Massilia sp. MB5]|uniref:hypothetical protein n=1 Tax=Massilia sp. MB5 TaxID=2919578 RepID=UPI001F1157C1|nr:hypothetical protein [Massilia sp. MB5]UMR31991.1 hypothetical protein MJ904_07390 [Massilia sp. MB5]